MAQRLFLTCYDLETGHEIHNSTEFDRLFAKVCLYCKGLLDTHAVVHLPSSQVGLEARQRTLTRFPGLIWHREGHKAPYTMVCQCAICNKVPSLASCMFGYDTQEARESVFFKLPF